MKSRLALPAALLVTLLIMAASPPAQAMPTLAGGNTSFGQYTCCGPNQCQCVKFCGWRPIVAGHPQVHLSNSCCNLTSGSCATARTCINTHCCHTPHLQLKSSAFSCAAGCGTKNASAQTCIDVKGTITGLTAGDPTTVHFHTCCPICVKTTVTSCTTRCFTDNVGHASAFAQVNVAVCGQSACFKDASCCGGAAICTPIVTSGVAAGGSINCFCLTFTPGSGSACLVFSEEAFASGTVCQLDQCSCGTVGGAYTAQAVADPSFSITVLPLTGGAPEVDPTAAGLPLGCLAALLALIADRRR